MSSSLILLKISSLILFLKICYLVCVLYELFLNFRLINFGTTDLGEQLFSPYFCQATSCALIIDTIFF